jgi:hypothetical protein
VLVERHGRQDGPGPAARITSLAQLASVLFDG